MTAIYLDGFDHYGGGNAGVANMLEGSWANVGFEASLGAPSWGSRTGTYALSSTNFAGVTNGTSRYVLPGGPTNHVYLSFGFSINHLPTFNNETVLVTFNDNTNTPFANVYLQSTGILTFVQGSHVFNTQGPVVVPANWHFVEMDLNYSSGTFNLRIDDASAANTPAIQVTSQTYGGASSTAQFGFNNGRNNDVQSWIDDLFIRDSTGSVNNGYLGDRRIATLLADTDTITQGWTPNFYHMLGAGILDNTATTPFTGVWVNPGTPQDLGSGDFTLEGFVRFQELPVTGKSVIWGKWDETHNQREFQLYLGSVALNGGNIVFQTSTDGTVSTVQQPIVYPFTPNLDQWYHIAVVRASGEDLLFINGAQMGLPIADSRTYWASTTYMGIGCQAELTGDPPVNGDSLQGWFDEIRFTVGNARYTTNFTPTTVEFPRGSGDPFWSDVSFLAGFDSTIQDESSHTWAMGATGSFQRTTNDGPSVGNFSTVGKAIPDDNTFISAPYVAATGILTLTANAGNNNTVTVGTKDGTTPAVYTFKTSLTGAAFEVFIDTNIQNTLQNLYNAINAGPGAGTKYGTGTTSNFDVFATQLPAGQMMVTANTAGTGGNSIPSTSSGITGSWGGSTLSGGLSISGPSNFKVQRLPPTTTLVSAVQISTRSFKSDSSVGTMNTAFVGALGGVLTGPTHALTLSPVYYNDVYQTDPDTAGPISPTTITNGAIQINRDT